MTRFPTSAVLASLLVALPTFVLRAQVDSALAAGPDPAPQTEGAKEGDDGQAGAADDAKLKARVIEMPNEETVEPAAADSKFDANAALTAAVNKMGYETFERQSSVEFVRRTYHWRDGKLSIYHSVKAYVNLRLPLVGKVQELSNYEGNRYVYFAAIANGDDAFELREKEVYSQPAHEAEARGYVVHELVQAFLPFYVKLTQAPLEYVGVSTIKGFEPQKFDEDKGWIDYQPVTRSYDLVRAQMGAPYNSVCGETVDLYFSRENSELVLIGARDIFQELTGKVRLYQEYLETQSAGGITVPKRIRGQVEFSGYRLQHCDLSDFAFHDQPVPPELLRRP